MLIEYEVPFDNLLSQIIPDHALSDRSGRMVTPHEMVNKLENLVENGRWIDWPENSRPEIEHDVSKALNRLAQAVSERCDMNLTRKYSTACMRTEDTGQDSYLVIISDSTTTEKIPKSELESDGLMMLEDVSLPNVQEAGDERCEGRESEEERTWKTTTTIGRLASTDETDNEGAIISLVECAQKIFNKQDNRIWLVTWTLTDADLVVYVFDRSGIVMTEKINIHERKEVFLRLVIGVLFVNEKYLGYDPTIKMLDGKRYITVKQFDDTHTELEIVKTIFRSKSIQGRGTTVWYVDGHLKHEKDKEGSTRRGYIVKDSWVDMSNMTKEYVILEKLRGFRNTPYMCTHEDMGGCTDYFRQGGVAINKKAKIVFREHHRVVLGTVGQPITDFKSSKELILSFMNIFLGEVQSHTHIDQSLMNHTAIIDLRIEKNILHRDISRNNLMLIDMGNGMKDGCLIDFDYSVDLSDENTHESLTKRSGTVPFMAAEVLRNEAGFVHKYYHDIESAFYVLIWICLERSREWYKKREKEDRRLKAPDYILLAQWDPKHIDKLSIVQVMESKYVCLMSSFFFDYKVLDLLSPEFENIKEYLEKLRIFISQSGPGVLGSERDPLVDREEIRKIHKEAFLRVAAKGSSQGSEESVNKDTAYLASDSQ